MEDSKQSEALSLEQFQQIMDKLPRLDNQMQEHFGNLTSEISTLKKSVKDVEKSIGAAWDSIDDIQEETKSYNNYKKTCKRSLDSHRQELDLLKVNLKKVDGQQAEIDNLKKGCLKNRRKLSHWKTILDARIFDL